MSAKNNREIGEEFLPAFFVDVMDIGRQFGRGEWPAHITLFPPIKQPYQYGYTETMRSAMNPLLPFEVTVGRDELFGAQ